MYQKRKKSFFKHFDFFIIDNLVIVFSFVLAFTLRFGIDATYHTFIKMGTDNIYQKYLQILLIVNFVVVVIAEPYSNILKRDMTREIKKIFQYNLYLLLGSNIALYSMMAVEQYSRLLIFGYVVYSVGIMILYRFFYKKFLRKRINHSEKNRLLLVAPYGRAANMVKRLNKAEISRVNVVGIILTEKGSQDASYEETGMAEAAAAAEDVVMIQENGVCHPVETDIYGVPIVGTVEELSEYVRTNVVDEVLICADGEEAQMMGEILYDMGVTVHINISNLVKMPQATLNKVNGIQVITTSIRYVTLKQLFLKRLIDICFGLAGSVITILLTMFIAPAIWIADGGPVFFRQERVGRNGRTFRIWKFRTMYKDAEARKAELMKHNKMDGMMFKMDDDPRIIGYGKKFSLGKFLRETSIDELPQSFNILWGSMSVVGTRPPLPSETVSYSNNHKVRLAVKPGLTGMWQVSGRSDITDFEEVVRLDKEYIENFSLGLDIRIILKTFKVVLARKGSV